MATHEWQEDPGGHGPPEDFRVGKPGSSAENLRQMRLVRRFVAEVLEDQGGDRSSVLSEAEWSRLCEVASNAGSDEDAIARLVMQAYGQGAATALPTFGLEPQAPTSNPQDVPPPQHLVDQVLAGSSPGQVLNLPIDPPGTIAASEGVPVSFVGKAWVGVDGQLPISAQPSPAAQSHLLVPSGPVAKPTVAPMVSYAERGVSDAIDSPVETGATRRRAHSRRRVRVMEDRRRERLLTVASWVRNIGAIILLFVAWQLWGTAITQHHSQTALQHQFATEVHHGPVKPAPGFTLIPATTRIPDPPQGTVMAHLQIPKISLDQYVVSGTAEGDLAKGPGHYLGTAMPGQAGNVAIAGHRTTHGAPFNRLAELAIGDPIYLTTSTGKTLTYIVSAVPAAVSPSDVTVLNNFGDDRLTLTTCNPEYSAVQRLIVVAAYLPPGATHPVPIAKGTGKAYALAPADATGWNTSLLPLVAVEILLLVGLGLAYRRLSNAYGRGARWLILGPVWLALLLALFETLTNFLPAAV